MQGHYIAQYIAMPNNVWQFISWCRERLYTTIILNWDFPDGKVLNTISGHAVGIVTNDGEVYIIDAVFSVHIYSR